MEATLTAIIRYIQQSERLIVVTVVLFISGLAAYSAEQAGLFNFADLPKWARPAAEIIWTVSAVHVAVRAAMALGSGFRHAFNFARSLPTRRRQARADAHIIERLLKTTGLPREILCYARYREDNNIWTDGGGEYRWLNRLKEAGLVELSDAGFHNPYYEIHHVAWKYMQRFPDRFVHRLSWRDPPWSIRLPNEAAIEKAIEERSK